MLKPSFNTHTSMCHLAFPELYSGLKDNGKKKLFLSIKLIYILTFNLRMQNPLKLIEGSP